MKLRIYKDSVRLRLSQADIAQFAATGSVRDVIDFAPGAHFSYALESASFVDRVRASYSAGALRILVPPQLADQWSRSDEVAIRSNGDSPSLLIEKDFKCLHRETDQESDDADAFPNPLAADYAG